MFKILQNIVKNQQVHKRFAGHSKWANIKHIKGEKDREKSLAFFKIARKIRLAIKDDKTNDPSKSLTLSQALQEAKKINMPQASINNALKSIDKNQKPAEKFVLELKGMSGTFILLEIEKSNTAKVKTEIGPLLKKTNVNYDTGGRNNFEHKGIIDVEIPENMKHLPQNELIDQCIEHAIDAGAEDVELVDDILRFVCDPKHVNSVERNLQDKYNIIFSKDLYLPNVVITLPEDTLEKYQRLIDRLKKHSEILEIYNNFS